MYLPLMLKNFILGLWGQVFLWALLPLMSLVIVFAFFLINTHQDTMHALAIEDSTALVRVLAQMVSMEATSISTNLSVPVDELSIDDLQLEQFLRDPHIQTTTSILLLDADGSLLFSYGPSDSASDMLNWYSLAKASSSNSGAFATSSPTQSDIIAYAPINNTDWLLIIHEYGRLLDASIMQFDQIIPITLLATIVISFMTFYFGLKKIVRPLNALEQNTHQIASGDFNVASTSVGGIREVEDLRLAINRMAYQIQRDQVALRAYLGAVTGAQEEERARLARELHDDTVQDLIALDHRVQWIQRTLKQNPDQASEHAVKLRQMIDKAIRDVRRMCMDLRPLYLDELGLVAALETLAHEANATFRVIGVPVLLSVEHEATLYRIVQEALSNAVNHAQAEKIRVEIQFNEKNFRLAIHDNGAGFIPQDDFRSLVKQRHFGLLGMRERAQLMKSKLQIQSSPELGTSVIVVVPIS
jgi:signal transduction histidine kinase